MTTTENVFARAPRRADAICPPWCAGHNERYQPWELSDGRPERDHASDDRNLHNVSLLLNAPEYLDGEASVLTPQIELYGDVIPMGPVMLNPTQAREVAAKLIELADRAEGWHA